MEARKQIILELLQDMAKQANLDVKHHEVDGLDDILFVTFVSEKNLRLDRAINMNLVDNLKISKDRFVESLIEEVKREFTKYKAS